MNRFLSDRRAGALAGAAVALAVAVVPALTGGCSALTGDRPALPDSVFVAVLTELHLAEVRVELDYPVSEGVADSVFARHGVSRVAFEETVEYYLHHTDEYIEIYNDVIEGLNEDRARF